MSGFVQGRNCLFKVNLTGSFLPLICAKTFNITVTSETVETSTQGTGQFKAFDYDGLSYTVSFDGIQKIVDDALNPTIFDALAAQLGFVQVPFKALYIDTSGITKQASGTAIINSTTLSVAINEPAGGSLEMQGTGELLINNPDSSCDILMTSFNMTGTTTTINVPGSTTTVTDSGPFTITPVYTNGPAVRFDYQVDGGGYVTVFTSSWIMDLDFGTHTIDIIPYCEGNISPGTFTADINIIDPS